MKKKKQISSNTFDLKKRSGAKKFKTSDDLWSAACQYFNHVDANIWEKVKTKEFSNGMEIITTYEKVKPLTLSGF